MLTQSRPPTRRRPPSGLRRTIRAVAGDVPEPPGGQVAAVEPFEHVVARTRRGRAAAAISSRRSCAPVGEPDRPAEVGDDQRQVAAEPAAEPRGGRAAERLAGRPARAGRGRCRSRPVVAGRLLDQQVAGRGDLAELLLGLEQGDEHAGRVGVEVVGLAEPGAEGRGAVGEPARGLVAEAARGPGPARPRAPGGRSTSGAGSARRRRPGRGRSGPPAGGTPAPGRRGRSGRPAGAARRTPLRACRPRRRRPGRGPTPPR